MATSLTATGVQFPDNSVQTAPALTGFRNRIINGDMRIAQRGTSFAAANNVYLLDRWRYGKSNDAAMTFTQSTDVPSGSRFSYSLRATVTTADASIAAGDYSLIVNPIEGYNIVDLVGVPITLSFWVKSSKTGIHCVAFRNGVYSRSYATEYTIIAANTWEYKSITIQSGLNTSSGAWDFSSGLGLQVSWSMAIGSTSQSTANTWVDLNTFSTPNQVNCLDTIGNIFAITGVQLEKGSTATDFEFRPYSVELAMCQRYYERRTVGSQNNERLTTTGFATSSSGAQFPIQHLVQKRSIPTIVVANVGSTHVYDGGGISTPTAWSLDNTGIYITNIYLSGITSALGRGAHWGWNNISPLPYVEIISEL